MKNQCESCLLPFNKDTGNRTSEKYCSLCWQNGDFTFKGTAKEFREMCYKGMTVEHHIPKWKAMFFISLIRLFAPRWKKAA